jgi:hypothetical protein
MVHRPLRRIRPMSRLVAVELRIRRRRIPDLRAAVPPTLRTAPMPAARIVAVSRPQPLRTQIRTQLRTLARPAATRARAMTGRQPPPRADRSLVTHLGIRAQPLARLPSPVAHRGTEGGYGGYNSPNTGTPSTGVGGNFGTTQAPPSAAAAPSNRWNNNGAEPNGYNTAPGTGPVSAPASTRPWNQGAGQAPATSTRSTDYSSNQNFRPGRTGTMPTTTPTGAYGSPPPAVVQAGGVGRTPVAMAPHTSATHRAAILDARRPTKTRKATISRGAVRPAAFSCAFGSVFGLFVKLNR